MIPFSFLRAGYLLDSCPAAFAAYSLRKISHKAQYAIRVVRSSDSTTKDIGFVGQNLDTATLLAFVGSGNGTVSIWYDQSGNGYHQIQSTVANQATIVSAGSLLTGSNGRPRMNFGGSAIYSTSSTVTMNGGAVSTFYVCSCNWSSNAYFAIISCGYGGFAGYSAVAQTGGAANDWTANEAMHVANGFRTAQSPKALGTFTPITANTWHLFDSSLGAAGSNIYKDGSNINTTTYSAAMPTVTANLNVGQDPGYSDNYNGDLSEVFNFLTQLPASSQVFIRNNVNKYYAMF